MTPFPGESEQWAAALVILALLGLGIAMDVLIDRWRRRPAGRRRGRR
jgi:hypothetical protein